MAQGLRQLWSIVFLRDGRYKLPTIVDHRGLNATGRWQALLFDSWCNSDIPVCAAFARLTGQPSDGTRCLQACGLSDDTSPFDNAAFDNSAALSTQREGTTYVQQHVLTAAC
jgi:hypothetical protein